jgi:magnesium chelatase subunit I
VLEGEQEGALNVARALLGRGVKALFAQRFPDAFKPKRQRRGPAPAAGTPPEPPPPSEYRAVLEWFASGRHVAIADDMPQAEYAQQLAAVRGLAPLAQQYLEPRDAGEAAVAMEFVLEGLHQNSMLSRERTDDARTSYKDMLKTMLSGIGED